MLVKVYKGRGARQRFQSASGDAPSDAFLAGAIQSAARSGRFSVEAGTRAAAPFPAPLSPLAASFLRCAPDRFQLTKPNTFQHNGEASVATLRWCSGSSRNAVRLPFGTGVQLRRNPQQGSIVYMVSNKGVYRSTDGGDAWCLLKIGLDMIDSTHSLAFYPGNSSRLVVGTRFGVVLLEDKGSRCRKIYPREHGEP